MPLARRFFAAASNGRVICSLAMAAAALLIGSLCPAVSQAVPAVSDQDAPAKASQQTFVRALYLQWYLPGSKRFADSSLALQQRLADWCAGNVGLSAARAQWQETLDIWSEFSAVRGGALLARRSPREVDFQPMRPAAAERAIAARASAPLAAIGSPAKGLPTLEWLLWVRPSDAAACRYATEVASAVHAEALALQAAYQRALDAGWDAQEADYALYEFLNLWDAGLQKLWWEEIDRPLQKRRSAGGSLDGAVFSRAASGSTLRSWQMQWLGLKRLALSDAPSSLASLLVSRGGATEAMRLQQLVARVDQALAALAVQRPSESAGAAVFDPAALAIAVQAMKELQQFVESDMATALNFVISFFDEDGD